MKERKKILLTFDYEPYLGVRSGSAKKCVLEPTEKLGHLLDKCNAKAVFFVDTLYLSNLKKHRPLDDDFRAIIEQLKSLHEKGHYIFPHIHPHWLDATYLEDKKEFSLTNLKNYSIANLDSSKIKGLFTESIGFLKEIGISYANYGYRAGGWCIQPFSSFKEIFLSENIKYDFSVLPGYKNESPSQFFDFSQVTNNDPYLFSEEVDKTDDKGLFIEFPISTIQFTSRTLLADRFVRKYLWKKGDRGWGDGVSAQTSLLKSNMPSQEMVSIELLTMAKLGTYKNKLRDSDYMHWISHPKMFTKHGLKTFGSFLNFVSTNYNPIFDFKEMMPKPTFK